MSDGVPIHDQVLDRAIKHLQLSSTTIEDMEELTKLKWFTGLRSADFSGTNLDDTGLLHVSAVTTLEWLDLQETQVTNHGIAFLGSLPKLWYLRLKGNPQLTNGCVGHLARLNHLANLQIQGTGIDERGVGELVALKTLRDLCIDVWRGNFSFGGLVELSQRMPACKILAKGNGEFVEGKFEGTWKG